MSYELSLKPDYTKSIDIYIYIYIYIYTYIYVQMYPPYCPEERNNYIHYILRDIPKYSHVK